MKAFEIEFDYYQYPKGIENLKDFADYLNKSESRFIELVRFNEDNCRAPYFISEETEVVYLNVSQIKYIHEVEITVLPKSEYECRLKKVVEEKCVLCSQYDEDSQGDNLIGHRCNINLDGDCPFFEKSEEKL